MQKRIQNGKRVFTGFVCTALVVFGLAACSSTDDIRESVISVKKDGAVSHVIRENFDESYFDLEELRNQVLGAVVSYNSLKGEEKVTVTRVQLMDEGAADGGSVTDVEMEYQSAEDYAEFNRETFFVGTPEQAQTAGFDLNRVYVGAGDDTQTIGMSELLGTDGVQLLITDTQQMIVSEKKLLYASENTEIMENGKAFRKKTDAEAQNTDHIYVIVKE